MRKRNGGQRKRCVEREKRLERSQQGTDIENKVTSREGTRGNKGDNERFQADDTMD